MKKEDSYRELLKDPRWIRKRNEILTRDENTCQYCGRSDRYMHVHHNLYVKGRKPWEYDNKDLVTLCDRCHESVTNDNREMYGNFLFAKQELRNFGFSDSILNNILYNIGLIEEFYLEDCEYNNTYIDLIENAVLNTQNHNDFEVLKKLGRNCDDFEKIMNPLFNKTK